MPWTLHNKPSLEKYIYALHYYLYFIWYIKLYTPQNCTLLYTVCFIVQYAPLYSKCKLYHTINSSPNILKYSQLLCPTVSIETHYFVDSFYTIMVQLTTLKKTLVNYNTLHCNTIQYTTLHSDFLNVSTITTSGCVNFFSTGVIFSCPEQLYRSSCPSVCRSVCRSVCLSVLHTCEIGI